MSTYKHLFYVFLPIKIIKTSSLQRDNKTRIQQQDHPLSTSLDAATRSYCWCTHCYFTCTGSDSSQDEDDDDDKCDERGSFAPSVFDMSNFAHD